jgi:hypothetical protein
MDQAFGKLVVTPDMVEVRVAGNRQTGFFGDQGHLLAQADDTHAAVEQ